jgi:GT2 family glycosyltransferase
LHVSFVIPLFNCLSLTQAMLRSLEATVPRDLQYEIVFVDDGSTDGTREWLQALPQQRYKIVLNAENLGYAASNNRGAAVATGQFLALLNNDLVLTEGWLEPMLQMQRDLPRAGAIGNVQWSVRTGEIDHAGIFINAKGKPQHDRRPPFWLERTRPVTAVTGACLLINRDLWNQVAGFDEHYINGCEDVDLCLRLATHRCTNAVALNSRIYHHVSASPGRKLRDEENTRRLTERWRDELALHGAVSWCREYVDRELNAAAGFSKTAASARIFAYAAGFTSNPPPEAISGMQFAIDRELDRWRRMFG